MSQPSELAPLEAESLSHVTGGMQGGSAMQLLSMLGGLRGAGGQGQAQEPSAGAEGQAQPSSGGLPADQTMAQIMAFAKSPSLESGMSLVGALMSRRSQGQQT